MCDNIKQNPIIMCLKFGVLARVKTKLKIGQITTYEKLLTQLLLTLLSHGTRLGLRCLTPERRMNEKLNHTLHQMLALYFQEDSEV